MSTRHRQARKFVTSRCTVSFGSPLQDTHCQVLQKQQQTISVWRNVRRCNWRDQRHKNQGALDSRVKGESGESVIRREPASDLIFVSQYVTVVGLRFKWFVLYNKVFIKFPRQVCMHKVAVFAHVLSSWTDNSSFTFRPLAYFHYKRRSFIQKQSVAICTQRTACKPQYKHRFHMTLPKSTILSVFY
jgi:hypothetical protein